jgi:hypothetical protein
MGQTSCRLNPGPTDFGTDLSTSRRGWCPARTNLKQCEVATPSYVFLQFYGNKIIGCNSGRNSLEPLFWIPAAV